MQRIWATLVLSALLFGPVVAEDAVYFADPHLKAAVEAELWVSDPTPTDMLGLTFLNASSSGIAPLTGLEYATNLQTLDLAHNQISDISPLSALSDLETLLLNTNQISDLSPLSGLGNLETLNLHANEISDISALSGLANLDTLVLRINRVSDISALSGLNSLGTLALESNQISDLSPLSGLSSLQYLWLGFNEISDISPLSGLGNLTYLTIGSNDISEISSLSGLSNLETLVLENNRISDISALSGLTSLGRLDLLSNPLNQEACDIYIPQIMAGNPGIYLRHDPCAGRQIVISSTVGGSITDPGEGTFTYGDGELVRVKAQADPGFMFVNFSGSYPTTQNPVFVTMNQDHEIQANFVSRLDAVYVDDDAPDDGGPGDSTVSDLYESGTPEHPFDAIQEAIDIATDGVSVIVRPGTYHENIDLRGKSIRLVGIEPDEPNGAAFPVIDGANTGPVVSFVGGEDPNCMLIGFVITRGRGRSAGAITCSGSSPTIANCLIVGNRASDLNGAAVYCARSNAVFANCTIADNNAGEYGAGITLVDSNVILIDSIVWGNMPNEVLLGGAGRLSITYTDVAGGWPDVGNIDADPLFAQRGYWADAKDPSIVVEPDDPNAIWIDGDYHLKSQAGRWDRRTQTWVGGETTSPCIDGGDPAGPVGDELAPNGGIVNMGAYGGTAEASKSGSGQ